MKNYYIIRLKNKRGSTGYVSARLMKNHVEVSSHVDSNCFRFKSIEEAKKCIVECKIERFGVKADVICNIDFVKHNITFKKINNAK